MEHIKRLIFEVIGTLYGGIDIDGIDVSNICIRVRRTRFSLQPFGITMECLKPRVVRDHSRDMKRVQRSRVLLVHYLYLCASNNSMSLHIQNFLDILNETGRRIARYTTSSPWS